MPCLGGLRVGSWPLPVWLLVGSTCWVVVACVSQMWLMISGVVFCFMAVLCDVGVCLEYLAPACFVYRVGLFSGVCFVGVMRASGHYGLVIATWRADVL